MAFHVDVTFVPYYGAAYPDQASAENIANWSISALTDSTLALATSTRQGGVGSLTYRLTFNHPPPAGTPIIITATSVATNLTGGSCRSPGTFLTAVPRWDCGIVSAVAASSKTVTVTFAAQAGGTAKPLQASAETAGNWTLTTTQPGLAISTVARVSDYVYLVTLSANWNGTQVSTLSAASVATDQGGLCGFALGRSPNYIDVVFAPYYGVAYPLDADLNNLAKWGLTCAGDPSLAITSVTTGWTVGTLYCRVAFNHTPIGAISLTLDGHLIRTNRTGGTCQSPGTIVTTTPAQSCYPSTAQEILPQTIRVTFLPVYGTTAKPTQASAEVAGNWTLTGDAGLTILSSTRVSDYVYDLALSRPATGLAVLLLDTSAIATTEGGHCNSPSGLVSLVASTKATGNFFFAGFGFGA